MQFKVTKLGLNNFSFYHYTLLICLMFIINTACSQDTLSEGLKEIELKIDKILSQQFDTDGTGYSLLIAKGDKVVYHKAAGQASLELYEKMTTDNVFRIASITKQFTAVAILQLIEAGKLNLNDPITNYVEIYPNSGITIEHLLSHTSGIPDFTKQPYFTASLAKKDLVIEDQIELFKNDTLLFEPGTAYSYSNSNYALLGKVIEVVSKSPYSVYLENNIIAPTKMTHTYYTEDKKIIKNRARGYTMDNEGYKNAAYLSDKLPYSSGGLLSTTGDMFKWHQALRRGDLISNSNLKLAQTPYTLKDGKSTGYGYGWQIGSFENQRIIYHNGAINGFLADALYLPEIDLFIVMMTNCDCNPPGMSISQIMPLFMSPNENEDQNQITYGINDDAGHYLNVGDAKIYYEVYGEGEPILLFHGGMFGYIDEYAKYIPSLSKNHKVIAIATRGHGRSELGKLDLSYALFAEDASKILKQESDERATIIGFSDGAITAYLFAASYASLTKKVVSLAGGFGSKWFHKEALSNMKTLTPERLIQQYPSFVKSRKNISNEPQRWAEFITKLNQVNLQEEYIEDAAAKSINCPVLVIGGDRDDYFRIDNFVHTHQTIPNSQLAIIPDCGHVDLLNKQFVFKDFVFPFVLNE